jgi:hypothetical protein
MFVFNPHSTYFPVVHYLCEESAAFVFIKKLRAAEKIALPRGQSSKSQQLEQHISQFHFSFISP